MQTTRYLHLVITLCVWFSGIAPVSAQNAGSPASEKEKSPERLIYMPFKSLKSVLEKPEGSVLIPYADYIRMWEKAFGDGLRKAEQAPVAAVISSASYSATVEKDVAQISAVFKVQVLEKGWAEVPVRFGEAAIGKLTSDSGKVLLRGTGNGTYSLLFPTVGEHKVELELTARVRSAPEGKSIELEVPPVGITEFELIVPEADQALELKPRLATQPMELAEKQSGIKASVGSTDKISVRWHPRIGTKPEMELLASATNLTQVTVADGLVHTDAWLTYEVLRGQLDKLKLVVPKGHRVLDITSDARVKEWNASEEDDRQIVSVELLSRVEGKIVLEIHTERALPDDALDIAGQDGATAYGIHALDVIRESGAISVKSSSDLTLTVEEQRGLLRVDENDIDQKLRHPGSLYYKYYSLQFRLRVLAKPVEPRMVVDHQSQLVFRDDQLRLKSILNYSIDRAGVFELNFKLPEGLTIENVICDQMKQFDVSPDKSMLTVGLREKTQGTITLTVTAVREWDATGQEEDQVAPLLEPEKVEVEVGRVQIYAPEAIDVISDVERLVNVQPDPSPRPESLPNARLVSSWIYNRRPAEIPIQTVQKPTRLTAVIVTRADVKQHQVQVTTLLNYFVEYAGVDTFRFAVPEAIADKLQIASTAGGAAPAIKQQTRAAEAEDGWVTWTVVMQRDVTGSQPFEVKYDLVPNSDEGAGQESTTIEPIRVLDPFDSDDTTQGKREVSVSRIVGEMTVVKERALSVQATATGGDVEPIDVRELEHSPQDGFVAYRYFKQPAKLDVVASRYDVQDVVETVVSKALVEIVLDRAGVGTNRCRYVLKSSERQRLRLDLPENVETLGVLVDRKPAVLEKAELPADKGWESYYVNVARTKPSDESFTLSVIFRHAFRPTPLQNAGGKLVSRLPLIGGASNANVAVQQLYVKVWVPPEYSLIGNPTTRDGGRVQQNFSVQTRTQLGEFFLGRKSVVFGEKDLDQWIGHDTGGIFDFPTEGKWFQYMNLGGTRQIEVSWWHLPFYTFVVSGALAAIALVLRNTSWDNKITLLILGVFAACAYALKDHDLVFHGLQVSAYGLIAAVAIWLIHSLFRGTRVEVRKPPLTPPLEPQPTASAT